MDQGCVCGKDGAFLQLGQKKGGWKGSGACSRAEYARCTGSLRKTAAVGTKVDMLLQESYERLHGRKGQFGLDRRWSVRGGGKRGKGEV